MWKIYNIKEIYYKYNYRLFFVFGKQYFCMRQEKKMNTKYLIVIFFLNVVSFQNVLCAQDSYGKCLSAICKHDEQLANQTENLQELRDKIAKLELAITNISSAKKTEKKVDDSPGETYVRFGRTVCNDTANLLYEGYMAKSFYNSKGGGVDYLCLPQDPEWPEGVTSGFQSYSKINGVEYQEGALITKLNIYQHDAPCAVCQAKGRHHKLMIPAKLSCPTNWTKEYSGLLMSEKYSHYKASYVCVDANPEIVPGGGANQNGGLLYTVEANCGESLKCPPYQDGYELGCVVCTI